MKKIYLLLAVVLATASSNAQVVISQVYGGGGNSGALYANDFVELFNRGTIPVNINGWSIQYASAAGVAISGKTPLPDFTLLPGQYYLVQENGTTGSTAPALPSPDLVAVSAGMFPDNPQISMSSTNFKIFLVNNNTVLPSFTDSSIVDLVGVGSASVFEGSAAAAVLSNTTGALRNNSGCTDTNDNASDFTVVAPTPRNSASAFNICTLGVQQNSISGLRVYPNPVINGNLYITSDNTASKQVTVFDVLGKQVIKTTVTNQPINVASLNSGVYIVKITEDGKTATRKLVIK